MAFAMHILLNPSSRAPNRGRRVPLAIADDLAAPRPFWELLQEFAVRAEWLRTFALASKPKYHRSPPIEGPGRVRVELSASTVDDS